MKKTIKTIILVSVLIVGCNTKQKPKYDIAGRQSRIIVEMIAAVNERDAEKYVAGFADNVQAFLESEMKVNGREKMKSNRADHFKKYPNIRSEIQHLVEIDNKVILHDKVWLDETDKTGQDIVEIFTFENGKVVKVDVIQPNDLFGN